MTLNSAKTEKINLKGDDKVLLIVCATTGNGVRIHIIYTLDVYPLYWLMIYFIDHTGCSRKC